MHRTAEARGFTLLEAMVALAIAGIVLAVGVPGLGAWISQQEVHDRAEALRHALDLARSEAIRRGGRVDLCPGASRCAGGAMAWEDGWIVVADAARGADASPIVRERRAPPGITIRGNRPVADYVSFTSLGRARRFDGALQMGTFIVCRSGQSARKVVLASSGRARIEASAEPCP